MLKPLVWKMVGICNIEKAFFLLRLFFCEIYDMIIWIKEKYVQIDKINTARGKVTK